MGIPARSSGTSGRCIDPNRGNSEAMRKKQQLKLADKAEIMPQQRGNFRSCGNTIEQGRNLWS
jgi:hypothetical protein